MGVSLRKGKAGALKAFVRRAPGHKSDSYETTFDRFCDIYDLAVISIDLFPTKIKNNARFSRFEDIDYDRCMVHIDQLFPGYSKGMKTQILHWVIF
ncbi:MAG: hypothetical protein GY935_03465 [Gammaproteobacteria bacterium]|nr:hypothetical protein [Gammaproteobacteria bacterium]